MGNRMRVLIARKVRMPLAVWAASFGVTVWSFVVSHNIAVVIVGSVFGLMLFGTVWESLMRRMRQQHPEVVAENEAVLRAADERQSLLYFLANYRIPLGYVALTCVGIVVAAVLLATGHG